MLLYFYWFLKHARYKHRNQPEAQHMEVLRAAVQPCQPAAGMELGYWGPSLACGMAPVPQRPPCGPGWPYLGQDYSFILHIYGAAPQY